MRPKGTKQVIRDDRNCLWHPFTWMPGYLADDPLVIAGAKGIYLRAADGRYYMDGVSSMWLNVHGHNRPEILRAIARQGKRFAHISVFGQTHERATTLARRLVAIASKGLTRVFYSDDGATSVEVALKLAFQFAQIRGETRKTKFLALRHAYHGDTLGAISVGDIEHFHHIFQTLLVKCYRTPSPADMDSDTCLRALEGVLKKHSDEICAFIVEPIVQGAAGMLVAAPGYLAGARKLCTKYRVPLIADEVFTGFGRTGRMFACEHEGVTPDILCLAKGLTGGTLPLAATLATDEIYEAFLGADRVGCTFFHGHSFTANPLGCAAALASLDLFEKDRTLDNVRRLEAIFAERAPDFARVPGVSRVRFKGAVFAFDLPKGSARPACAEAQKRGLLIRPLGDTVYLVPPLATTERELRKMLDIVALSLREGAGMRVKRPTSRQRDAKRRRAGGRSEIEGPHRYSGAR